MKGGKEIRRFSGHVTFVRSVTFSPSGYFLASGGGNRFGADDCSTRVWDLRKGNEVRQYRGQYYGVVAVAFSPSGKFLASGERIILNII